MEKKETEVSKILDLCEKELRTYKKKWVVDTISDVFGWNGIIYYCLECMASSGKYKYPTIYKYRKELIKYFKECIKYHYENWEVKQ